MQQPRAPAQPVICMDAQIAPQILWLRGNLHETLSNYSSRQNEQCVKHAWLTKALSDFSPLLSSVFPDLSPVPSPSLSHLLLASFALTFLSLQGCSLWPVVADRVHLHM